MQEQTDKPEDFLEIELKENTEAHTIIHQDASISNVNCSFPLSPLANDEKRKIVFVDQAVNYSQLPQNFSNTEEFKQDGIVIDLEPTDNISSMAEDDIKIIKFAIFAKYCALANIIIDALLALALPYLIVILLFNILGYCGAKNLNKCLCSGYSVFLCVSVVARIFLMIYFPVVYVVIIFSLLVIFQIFLLGVYLALAQILFRMDSEKKQKIFESFRQGSIKRGSFWAIF